MIPGPRGGGGGGGGADPELADDGRSRQSALQERKGDKENIKRCAGIRTGAADDRDTAQRRPRSLCENVSYEMASINLPSLAFRCWSLCSPISLFCV